MHSQSNTNREGASNEGSEDSGNRPVVPTPEHKVFQEERECLRERRRRIEAGARELGFNSGPIAQDLVGLALSGGGIRSGAVSLGFMQAMYRRGVWPSIDYLSMVSGGGYAGGMVTAAAYAGEKCEAAKANNAVREALLAEADALKKGSPPEMDQAAKTQEAAEQVPSEMEHGQATAHAVSGVADVLGNPNGSRAPKPVWNLIHNGRYLVQLPHFFGRYLMGLLVCLGLCGSALVAVCAALAAMIRYLDAPVVRDMLKAGGIEDDVLVFLLPGLVPLALGFCIWIFPVREMLFPKRPSNRRVKLGHNLPQIAIQLFLFVALLAGIAALAGSQDLDLNQMLAIFPAKEQGKVRNLEWLTNLLIPAILAALIPYLRPRRLLQSGTNPSGLRDKVIYQLAASALAVGVPFLTLMHFARENISGINESRAGYLTAADISTTIGWGGTSRPWQRLRKILAAVDEQDNQEILKEVDQLLETIASVDRQIDILQTSVEGELYSSEKRLCFTFPKLVDVSRLYQCARQKRACLLNLLNQSLIANSHLVSALHPDMAVESGEMAHAPTPSMFDKLLAELKAESLSADNESKKGTAASSFKNKFDEQVLKDYLEAARLAATKQIAALTNAIDNNKQVPNKGVPDRDDAHHNLAIIMENDRWFHVRLTERNRELVAALVNAPQFGNKVIGPATVLDADQSYRWNWSLGALLVLLFLGLIDQNRFSMNPFYEHCLHDAWIKPVINSDNDPTLNSLSPTPQGGPYPVITGAAFLSSPFEIDLDEGHLTQVRRAEEFLFSPKYCGAETTDYYPSNAYDGGRMTLTRALAISGAAVAPIQQPHLMMAVICFALNLRLSRWCPLAVSKPKWWFWNEYVPGCRLWVKYCWEMVAGQRGTMNLCYVTDGGVQENLGIRPLLKRRCRLIIACDATNDADYLFEDLTDLMRWSRTRDGIEITPLRGFEFDSLRPQSNSNKPKGEAEEPGDDDNEVLQPRKWADSNVAAFEIKYPSQPTDTGTEPLARDGLLLYFKSVLTGDEPLDLRNYARTNPVFPHDSTADQFYPPEQFESYRQLGCHLFDSFCGATSSEENNQYARPHDALRQRAESMFLPGGVAQNCLLQMVMPRSHSGHRQGTASGPEGRAEEA